MVLFEQLVDVFGSRMKVLEILCLLNNTKPVVRHGFYEPEIKNVISFCDAHSLFVEQSRHAVLLEGEGFTNKGKTSDKGMRLLYLCKDELVAAQTCLYETQQDHFHTGLMLGYPACCVRFFCDQFAKNNLNPVHVPTNQWTNLSLREQDICLLSHFQCSSDCTESILIAQQHFDILQKADKETAALFFQRLQK